MKWQLHIFAPSFLCLFLFFTAVCFLIKGRWVSWLFSIDVCPSSISLYLSFNKQLSRDIYHTSVATEIVGIIMFPQDFWGSPGKAYKSPISFLLHSPKHPVRAANFRFPRVSLISCLSQKSSSCTNHDNSQPCWRKQFSYSSQTLILELDLCCSKHK